MYCKKCGNQLSATAVFCGSCGNPTNKGNATPPVCRTGRQKKSPVKLIIAGISAAAIIAGVAVVMVFFPFWEDTASPAILAEEPLLLAGVEENGESGEIDESENIEETAALPELIETILPLTPGTFSGMSPNGRYGDMRLDVVVDTTGRIVDIVITEINETPSFADPALAHLIPAILAAQSTGIDTFTGATETSLVFFETIEDALVSNAGITLAELRAGPVGDVAPAMQFTSGTFLGIGTDGWNNDIHVEVVFSDNAITAVEVVFSEDTPSFADPAFAALIPAVLAAQSADIDNFTGATVTSGAFLAAVQHAIEQSVAGVADVPPAPLLDFDDVSWRNAYAERLANVGENTHSFALRDIAGTGGIPMLILATRDVFIDQVNHYSVYFFNENIGLAEELELISSGGFFVELSNFGGDISIVNNPDFSGLFAAQGMGDSSSLEYLHVVNGEITFALVSSTNWRIMSWDNPELSFTETTIGNLANTERRHYASLNEGTTLDDWNHFLRTTDNEWILERDFTITDRNANDLLHEDFQGISFGWGGDLINIDDILSPITAANIDSIIFGWQP
ncbi:MAG: FMN-binding protein [Defluviitaleaceae bacterium]|nr:FMN-binding protein [Defluviitaleaceae bacterium]